jgi:hypothetical protein
MLILKIILKNKKYYFNIFINKNILKRISPTDKEWKGILTN